MVNSNDLITLEVEPPAEGATDDGQQDVLSPGTGDKSDAEDKSDDESESDDDRYATTNHTELQHIVASIKGFEEKDWADADTKQLFGENSDRWPYLGATSERKGDGILHILMTEDYDNKKQRENLGKAIQCTIQYHPKMWTARNDEKLTPLYLALTSLDAKRVDLLKKHLFLAKTSRNPIPRAKLEKAIATACPADWENCLHLALKHRIRSTSLLTSMIKYASPEAVNATDGNSWTPLHRAARYDYSSQGSLKIIKALIARGEPGDGVSRNSEYALDTYVKIDKELLSVYQYHMKTRDEMRPAPSSSRQANKPSRKESSKAEMNTRGANRSIGNSQLIPARDRANMGATRTVAEVSEELKEDELRKVGLRRSSTFNVPPEATAVATDIKKESRDKDQAKEKVEQWSELIRSELKLHCLRTRTFSQAVRFLYGSNPDSMFITMAKYVISNSSQISSFISIIAACPRRT